MDALADDGKQNPLIAGFGKPFPLSYVANGDIYLSSSENRPEFGLGRPMTLASISFPADTYWIADGRF